MTGQQPNLFSNTTSEVLQRLPEQFQIIATDRANISEGWFQDFVRERIGQDTALVPQEGL